MAITYVGGQTAGRAGAASTTNVTYALTGGSNSTPQAGDLVVITMVVGSQARNPAQAVTAPATFTSLGQLNPNTQTYDTSMNVSYKFMGGTPDTTFTAPSTGNVADAQRWTVQVFRGVDPTTPLDVAAVAASAVGTSRCNPGSITPTTTGAWVVICGGGAAATGAAYTAPANYTTNFLTGFTADTNDALVGSGYRAWTSGAEDPAVYTGGSTATTSSWAAYTIALRPASNVTLALTGAQVAAQAGTLTKSNTGNVTLTGAQVTASAGALAASAGSPILQHNYVVDDSGGSGTTIAATLNSVTAGSALIAFVGWDYNQGGADITCSVSDGSAYTAAADGECRDTANGQMSQVFYLPNAGSGSHTITATFSETTSYRRIRVVEVAGLATSGIEDRAANQAQMPASSATDNVSSSATSATTNANDCILGFSQNTGEADPASTAVSAGTGFTEAGSNNLMTVEYKTVSTTGTQTATFTQAASMDRTTHVLALKQAGGTSDVNVTLTGAQVAAQAGSVTTSQTVSAAITGAQATAHAGSLAASQQVSKALTGEQVAAQAGSVTSSQAVTKALSGAQVAASAGTLTTTQQVTKALTGEQVSALAGTLTASQSTSDVDVTLSGAQVAAQAGTLTASQQVSKTLTGAQVAASAGTVTPSQQVTKALTGAQVTTGAGTVGKQISLVLTGAQAAAQVGTVTASQQVSKALAGAQVAASAGTIGVTQSTNDVTLPLTGAQVAAQAGTVTPSQAVTKALIGAQVAASAGALTTSQLVSLALSGAQAAAEAGALAASQQVTKALTGAQVAAQAGTVGKQITIALTGAQVNAGTGTITTAQTSFVTLTGAQATAEAGVLAASQQKSVALTGAQVAAQAGIVGKQFELFRGLTGAEVTVRAGAIGTAQALTCALTGAQTAAQAGTIGTAQALSRALTGAQVATQSGSVGVQREFFAALLGAQVGANAGLLSTSQALTRVLTGAQAVAQAGNLDAGVSLQLFVTIPLQGARVVTVSGRLGVVPSSQYPAPGNVASGVKYGPTGVEFTGTMVAAGYNRGRVVNE